jgi:hypothetical protein
MVPVGEGPPPAPVTVTVKLTDPATSDGFSVDESPVELVRALLTVWVTAADVEGR